MASLIASRRAKFDVHIKIFDLNNVPLASGESFIKWHLRHKMHTEQSSGHTDRCDIVNHRVDYNYAKTISHVRIAVDSKTNHLADCPIEFEILQAFTGHDKTTLGVVRLNLNEYVEESEAFLREKPLPSAASTIARGRSSSVGVSPTNPMRRARKSIDVEPASGVVDGIVRRYLLQESKVNSTLKISILMVQVDGDRNYIAPPLRSAPTFGGIAGIVANEPADDDTGPTVASLSKSRDVGEIQDLYRRTLVASWCRLPAEPTADESIEDIFAGGNGWRARYDSSTTESEEDVDFAGQGTLRPSDFRRVMTGRHRQRQGAHHHGGGGSNNSHHSSSSHRNSHHSKNNRHDRIQSESSDLSTTTITGRGRVGGAGAGGKDPESAGLSRSGSLGSLTPTLSSDRSIGRGDTAYGKHVQEVGEDDVRDDLIAWSLRGGGVTA